MPKCSSVKVRNDSRRNNYQQTQGKPRTGYRWQAWEMERVIEHTIDDRELSQLLERSVMAIQLKRSRMLMEDT